MSTNDSTADLKVQVAVLAATDQMHGAHLHRIEAALATCAEQTAKNQQQLAELTQLAKSAHKRIDGLEAVQQQLAGISNRLDALQVSFKEIQARIATNETETQKLKTLRIQIIAIMLFLAGVFSVVQSNLTFDFGVKNKDSEHPTPQPKDDPSGRTTPQHPPHGSPPEDPGPHQPERTAPAAPTPRGAGPSRGR